MAQLSTVLTEPAPSLDALYALSGDDLKRIDALILRRISNEVPLIEDVARHLIASGGKRIRPALTLTAARLCGCDNARPLGLAAAIEFIHTATLLHDDVVDASILRRGIATANEVFGNKASVLVGDFLLGQAFQLAVEDGDMRVFAILAEASAIIAKGEVMQLMNDRNLETTIDDYLRVISAKTAALFAAACELGAAAGGGDARMLKEFGLNIGIAFQLVDDVLDYGANQKTLGKTVGDDFREGKVTLPVILAWSAGDAEEKRFWQRTVAESTQGAEDFAHAAALIARHQAAARALDLAEAYAEKARAALSGFAPSPARDALLEAVDFAVSRAY